MEDEKELNPVTDSTIIGKEMELASQRGPGLSIISAPTGSGKSFNLQMEIVRFIQRKVNDALKGENNEPHSRMIILVPNRNNFPKAEDLVKKYSKVSNSPKELSDILKNVLYMKDNLTCIIEGIQGYPGEVEALKADIDRLDIPQKDKKDLKKPIDDIQSYISYCKTIAQCRDPEIRTALISGKKDKEKAAGEAERTLRKGFSDCIKQYKKEGKTDRQKMCTAKEIEELVRKFYNLANYDTHCVWILTVDKFMYKYDPVIEKRFQMLYSEVIDSAIIYIDESDSAYDRMRSNIINAVNTSSFEFKELLVRLTEIYFTRKPTWKIEEAMNGAFKEVGNPNRLENLKTQGDIFKRTFHLDFAYKTDEESVKKASIPALLNDGHRYNLGNGPKYVKAVPDMDRKQVMLSLGDIKKRPVKPDPDELDMLNFFHDGWYLIWGYVNFLRGTAQVYQKIREREAKEQHQMNPKEPIEELEFTDALYTVMNGLGVTDKDDKKLFLALCLRLNSGKKKIKGSYWEVDTSFYYKGYDLKVIEDDARQQAENSVIKTYLAKQTPEYLLYIMACTANVICLSATALNRSVNENFSIPYLKYKLGENYHEMSEEGVNALRWFYNNRNQAYYSGEWKITVDTVPEIMNNEKDKRDCVISCTAENHARSSFRNPGYLKGIQEILFGSGIDWSTPKKVYLYGRYMNLVYVLHDFIAQDDMQSLVCLEKIALRDNLEYQERMVREFVAIICKDLNKDPNDITIFSTTAEDFDNITAQVKAKWEKGEKAILFSTYSTTSKGSNLQYRIPDNIDRDNIVQLAPDLLNTMKDKYTYKDIDCLYLGNYTHRSASIEQKEEDWTKRGEMFHQVLFETEKLYEEDQINYLTKKRRVKDAYMSFKNPNGNYETNKQVIERTEGIKNTVNKVIKQSVGRMDRVNSKYKRTKIYIAGENLLHLDRRELAETEQDLIPAMREIKKTADFYAGSPMDEKLWENEEKNRILRRAAKLHKKSCKNFKRLLHTMRYNEEKRRDEAIERYRVLRELVLRHPVLSETVFDTLSELEQGLVKQYYFDSGRNDIHSVSYKPEDQQYMEGWDLDTLGIEVLGFNLPFNKENRSIEEAHTVLPIALKVNGVSDLFDQNRYAKQWESGRYILTPKGMDIYNGILGEVVEKVILDRLIISMQKVYPNLKGRMLEDMAPEVVEKFDFKFANIYIDAKNWRYGAPGLSAQELQKRVMEKKAECDEFYKTAGTAVILNLFPMNDQITNERLIKGSDYIEIRRLIRSDGSIDNSAIQELAKILEKAE